MRYLVRAFGAGAGDRAALAALLAEAVRGPPPDRTSGLYADRRTGRLLLVVEADRAPAAGGGRRGGGAARWRSVYRVEEMSGAGGLLAAVRRRVAPADADAYRAWEAGRLHRAAARPGVVALALLAFDARPGEHLLLGAFADAGARDRYRRAARAWRGCPVPVLGTDTLLGAPLRDRSGWPNAGAV